MSSVTAVPLRPTRRRVLVSLWAGIGLAVAAAGGLAWATTSAPVAQAGTPEQFLAWNARQPGVVTTESGLQYRAIEPGEGATPTMSDVVLVNYTGTLRDGSQFDQGERAPFPLAQVVPGFAEGMTKMPKGSKYRIWLPPALGYGEQSPGPEIPANSVLIFDVEMIDFIPAAVLQQMQGMGGMPGMPGGMPPGGPAPGSGGR